jgi:uncharacterized protein YjbJ (UPF0337 family)
MALVGSVIARFGAATADYSKQVDGARKQTNGFYRDVIVGAKQAAQANDSFLKELKSNFGKGSSFTQSLKAFSGGGAILGLGLLARESLDFTEKMKDAAVAVHEGGSESRKMAAELLKSIPIAGKLGEALTNVYDILTGTATYAADLKRATEMQEQYTDWLKETAKVSREYHEQAAKGFRDIQTQIEKLSLSGLPLKLFEVDESYKSRLEETQKRLSEFQKNPAFNEAFGKISEERLQRASELQAKIAVLREQQRGSVWQATKDFFTLDFGAQSDRDDEIKKLQSDADTLLEQRRRARERINRAQSKAEESSQRQTAAASKLYWLETWKAVKDAARDAIISPTQDWLQELKEGFKQWRDEKQESANEVIGSIDPAAKFQKDIDKLRELKNLGLLTQQQFKAAADDAYKRDFREEIEAARRAASPPVEERRTTYTVSGEGDPKQLAELAKIDGNTSRSATALERFVGSAAQLAIITI